MPIDTTDPEYQASRAAPSHYSNRAYVTVNGGLVRLAFGEAQTTTEESKYFSAVMMTKSDARELANLILSLTRDPLPPPAPFGGNGLSAIGGAPGVRRP